MITNFHICGTLKTSTGIYAAVGLRTNLHWRNLHRTILHRQIYTGLFYTGEIYTGLISTRADTFTPDIFLPGQIYTKTGHISTQTYFHPDIFPPRHISTRTFLHRTFLHKYVSQSVRLSIGYRSAVEQIVVVTGK